MTSSLLAVAAAAAASLSDNRPVVRDEGRHSEEGRQEKGKDVRQADVSDGVEDAVDGR